MDWPKHVTIKEVGPRDGLQNEPLFIETEDKIAWINRLSGTGLQHIEMTSFVNPKWIPALLDAAQVARGIQRNPAVTYSALIPNFQGLERALAASVDEVAVVISASEMHNRRNINQSIADSLITLKTITMQAGAAGKAVRGYLSTVFGCPYEGEIALDQVLRLTEKMFEMGVYEVSLGDTIGVAHPRQVEAVVDALLLRFPVEKIALHFHNTRGMALANIVMAMGKGISIFDASLGGLGGCPYAPGAAGNVATDDLNSMLRQMGIVTGLDQERLLLAACFIEEKLGRALPSHALQIVHGKLE